MRRYSTALGSCFLAIALLAAQEPSTRAAEQQALLRQLQSPRVDDRMKALHQLVGTDKNLPILKNATIRAALIELLNRETQARQHSDLAERVDYQYYESFLSEVAQKIAEEYPTPDAWAALVYSSYAAASPLGQWLAKQPQTYPLLLKWVDDENFVHRHQAFDMFGEICTVNSSFRPKILPLLHKRIGSSEMWTRQAAIGALASCGSEADIELLRKLPACSNLWNVRIQCTQVESLIAKRIGGQAPDQPRVEMNGSLPGKPFQANFERIGRLTVEGSWVRRMFRSSNGSTRVDLSSGDSRIVDMEGERLITLLPSARTALATKLPFQAGNGMWNYHADYAKPTDEVSTILNVPCRQVVLSDDPAGTKPAGEVWIAEDFGVVLKDVAPLAGGASTWKVSSISFSEPDLSVFKIPAGYTLIK